jgi:hypothetical protein
MARQNSSRRQAAQPVKRIAVQRAERALIEEQRRALQAFLDWDGRFDAGSFATLAAARNALVAATFAFVRVQQET